MKTSTGNPGIRTLFLIVTVLAILATPVLAQVPSLYESQSSCTYNDSLVLDPSANGNARVCLRQTTISGCAQYNFCVWRNTTAQNSLADHSANEYPGQVSVVYTSPAESPFLKVMVYQAAAGPAVTAIMSTSELLLVGAGGGREYANNARMAFQGADNGFTGKKLVGIVLPSVDEEDSWGVTYWRSQYPFPAPLIMNASYMSALAKRDEVKNSYSERHDRANGGGPSGQDPATNNYDIPNPWNLTWGPNDFLGAGSMREYRPRIPSWISPRNSDMFVSGEQSADYFGQTLFRYNAFHVDSNPVMFIPTSDEDAGLLVYLPLQRIMIAGNLGEFLPDAGSITGPNLPVETWMQTLDKIRAGVTFACPDPGDVFPSCHNPDVHVTSVGTPDYLITGRGLFMTGAQAISDRLTAQYDALQYLHTETLKWINNGLALDDIVATVKLPGSLASSPYNAQFVSTVPGIVRTIYHDHVGWFDGNPANLESLSTIEQALRLIDFGGGEGSVLNYINKCITEHTRNGAMQALKMASVLRQVSPSTTVDALYVQALRYLAWTTPSAHLRNYYLTEVQKVLNPTLQ